MNISLEKRTVIILFSSSFTYSLRLRRGIIGGHGLCPVASATGRVGYAICVQFWTRVALPGHVSSLKHVSRDLDTCRISNASSGTGHWT